MKNFSLKAKLLSLSMFLMAISIVIGTVSYFSIQSVVKEYSVIADTSYPNTSTFLQMYSNYRMSRIEILQLVSGHLTADEKQKSIEAIEKGLESDKKLQEDYMAIEFLPGEDALYTPFRKSVEESNAYISQVLKLVKENKTDAESVALMNDLVFNKMKQTGFEGRAHMHKVREFHYQQAQKAEDSAKAAGSLATKLTIGLILVLGSIGLVVSFMFSNMLTKTLKEISDALDESSAQVSSAAGQIASSSEDLSQAATEQAASLEETSSSVEEMSSMVNINSENAKKASENSLTSKRQAERGRAVVEEMVSSMAQINESNNNIMNQINYSNEQMGEIVKVIQEIETKTKVINDIVFQTKLLSFNASVEAARAGEQGKGFAVVAEEVGNLAQMSGNAAKEISDMLASSVHKVEGIVTETKTKVNALIADGKEKVRTGTKVAEECGGVLSEIVINVTTVSTMASEISNASDEQAKGIQEITKAMGQLDQVTQTNSATSEEAASAAQELSAQADSLKNQVLTLVAVISGANAPVAAKDNYSKPSAPSNVVQMKRAEVKKSAASQMAKKYSAPVTAKKVSGGSAIPDHNHPGFEEV